MRPGSRFGTVIFDCDSTLSTIEGIEELAVAHRGEVEALTEAAMRGSVPLEEVYGRRLALVQPSMQQVEALGRRYIATLVPDAREVVRGLCAEGVDVRVISGGLRPAVVMLARELGLEASAVRAVQVYFAEDGAYSGFDVTCPLTTASGKRTIIEGWDKPMARPIMLVGDGATDLEAQSVVDAFVAFAGVAERGAVVSAADFVIRECSLAPVLALALGGRAPAARELQAVFERGRSVLENDNRGS